jgi:hypothetical protein
VARASVNDCDLHCFLRLLTFRIRLVEMVNVP